MALKAMIFIDGSWFYHSRQILFDLKDEAGFEIDYKRLPVLIGDWLSEDMSTDVDVVRTCYFGTLPINKTGYNPTKQRAFYGFIQSSCGFDVEVLDIDYKLEQGVSDDRRVGVALSTTMTHYAAVPGAYDIAVIVCGSSDYRPLISRVRSNWGRRTMLVTMKNTDQRQACSPVLLSDPLLFDAPPLYLDDHIDELRLQRKELPRVCKSCGETEITTWAGEEFYCSKCRSEHRRRVRTCDTCGAEEETTWDKDYFYCTECRKNFRQNSGSNTDFVEADPV